MEHNLIIEALKRWNPWASKVDAGVTRPKYIKQIMPYMERKEILVLKGIRRSGKSTIMRQFMEDLIRRGVGEKQILYLNLEDYHYRNDLRLEFFDEVLNAYKEHTKNKNKIFFFVDEAQNIPGWERWVRTLYDRGDNIKFIISGSSASLISRELSTLLTGRNLSFTIWPLSYVEFLDFKKEGSLDEYMTLGGFPEVVLETNEQRKLTLLRQYFEDIIYKDVVNRYALRNPKLLIDLASYLVSTAGSKVSYNKLSRVFGIGADTIAKYVSYMIDAFLFKEVTYFSYSAKIKHDVTKLPKLYVMDNGLIDVVAVKYSKNKGQKFENTVLIKLLENHEYISYWSELKSEVDFIGGHMAINVTATDKIPTRERQGLKEFQAKHKDFSPLIISESTGGEGVMRIEDFLKSNPAEQSNTRRGMY